MPKIDLPYFGTLDTAAPAELVEQMVPFNGREVELQIWFDEPGPRDAAQVAPIRALTEDLPATITTARTAILSRPGDEAIALYVSHHQQELPSELGGLSKTQFLEQMFCLSLSFYPEDNAILRMDFTIDDDLTQYLLCVEMNGAGEVLGIEMES